MESKSEIKIQDIDIFYSVEENAWVASIELTSGRKLDIEGIIPEVKIGNKYIQSNFFVADNLTQELSMAIKNYYVDKESNLIFIDKEKFLFMEKQKESQLLYKNDNVIVENVEIINMQIILKEHSPEDIIFMLKTGEQFVIDGRLNFKYIDGTIQYTNVFIIRNGIYPCDKNGEGIFDRIKLHNEFVNKGFLSEILEHNGKITYKLSPSFNTALTKAILNYNKKNTFIKIFSSLPERFSMLSPEITQKFYDANYPNAAISIYSIKKNKSLTNRICEIEKENCDIPIDKNLIDDEARDT